MRCSSMNQDENIKAYFSFNIQYTNKIRLIKVDVANYRIKIEQGSIFWRDFFF